MSEFSIETLRSQYSSEMLSKQISLGIDVSGRKDELETLAQNYNIITSADNNRHFDGVEVITMTSSIITILQFLTLISDIYGYQTSVVLKHHITKRPTPMTIKSAILYITDNFLGKKS